MTRLLPVIIAIGLQTFATVATAQAPSVKARADQLFNEGLQAIEEGDLDAALSKYQRSYDLVPQADLFIAIGQVYEEQGLPVTAANHYQQYLDSGASDPELVTIAMHQLEQLDGALGLLSVSVRAVNRTDVEIRVTGGSWMEQPASGLIRVAAGAYEVRARTRGGREVVHTDVIAPGQRANITLDLNTTKRIDLPDELGRKPAGPATVPQQPVAARLDSHSHAASAMKSPVVAAVLSWAGTAAAWAIVGVGIYDGSGETIATGSGVAFLAPSFGHWYAGQPLTMGMPVRVVGGMLLGLGISRLELGDDDDATDFNNDSDDAVGEMAVVLGAAAVVVGTLYDTGTASDAARRWNRRHLTIAPIVSGSTNAPRVGLGLSGTF